MLFLTGCNPFDTSDYERLVVSVSDESIMVCPCDGNPEAEFPIYEIFVEAETEIEGQKASFAEIEEQDKVRVWVKERERAALIAEKIFVESDEE